MSDTHTETNSVATPSPKTKRSRAKATKTGALLNLLRSKRGASIEQLQQASGWQSHSVRGFLSGTVRRKLGLTLVADTGKNGLKRYRIEENAAGK